MRFEHLHGTLCNLVCYESSRTYNTYNYEVRVCILQFTTKFSIITLTYKRQLSLLLVTGHCLPGLYKNVDKIVKEVNGSHLIITYTSIPTDYKFC